MKTCATCECQYARKPKEQIVSQLKLVCHNRTQPKRSLYLIRPCTAKCMVKQEQGGCAQALPKCPGCEAQEPGASRCRQRRSVLHDQVVLSVGSRLPACQGLLPPRATSPSGCGPCADTLVRPTKTEFAANTGTRVARHQEASSANVRRCTTTSRPGATDRRPAAARTGTAATSCHHRQTTSGPAAESCIILIAGEHLRAPGEQSHPRVCCLPGKVCTRGV